MYAATPMEGSGPVEETDGFGIPVVFLHSLGGSPRHWKTQLEQFRGQRRAVALTLPGHPGAASPPDHRIDTLARMVVEEIEAMGLPRLILVGHSISALVAIECAALGPGRVVALVLVDPGSDPRRFPPEQAEAMLSSLRSESYPEVVRRQWELILENARPETAATVLDDLAATPKETVVGVFSELSNFDPVTPLRAFNGPVLVISGRASEGPHSIQSLVPGIQQMKMEGTSHWLHLDKPEEFGWMLRRFVESVQLLDPEEYTE